MSTYAHFPARNYVEASLVQIQEPASYVLTA